MNLNNSRQTQMKVLLILTSISLVPVYILIGWQSGGHGPKSVADWFWYSEAAAWGIRAIVESMALIYLFNTRTSTPEQTKILTWFEGALITLIGVTVTLLIVSNGSGIAISQYGIAFYVWSGSVAAFAPLMLGSVGYAYKVHVEAQPIVPNPLPIDDLTQRLDELATIVEGLAHSPVDTRRERVRELYNTSTQGAMAKELRVSVGTIQNDIKALGLNGK